MSDVTVVTAKNIYCALQFARVVLCVIRDQKAAGSNPATSTPGSVDFPTLPGFSFLAELCYFSGLQPAGLQWVAKAHFFEV